MRWFTFHVQISPPCCAGSGSCAKVFWWAFVRESISISVRFRDTKSNLMSLSVSRNLFCRMLVVSGRIGGHLWYTGIGMHRSSDVLKGWGRHSRFYIYGEMRPVASGLKALKARNETQSLFMLPNQQRKGQGISFQHHHRNWLIETPSRFTTSFSRHWIVHFLMLFLCWSCTRMFTLKTPVWRMRHHACLMMSLTCHVFYHTGRPGRRSRIRYQGYQRRLKLFMLCKSKQQEYRRTKRDSCVTESSTQHSTMCQRICASTI